MSYNLKIYNIQVYGWRHTLFIYFKIFINLQVIIIHMGSYIRNTHVNLI